MINKTLKTPLPINAEWADVHGWAETQKERALVAYPVTVDECISVIEFSKKEGMTICPRGGGYTFGDMILNCDQVILDLSRMNKILNWDKESGIIVVQPGVRFSNIF